MSDLFYGGGSGNWSSLSGYPPSFDPNNPMGTSGGGSYNPSPSPDANYYSFNKIYADPLLTPEWFILNINTGNPYTQSYIYSGISTYSNYYSYIINSGNAYDTYGSQLGGSYYDFRVYNYAYTDFENKATAAQNEYYATQTAIQYANIDSARDDLIASYGNIKDSSIAAKIEQLGDLTAQYEKLSFEDSITDYLNRIADSNNAAELASLAQQITELDSLISKELVDYYRVQENIRREQREFFGGFGLGNVNWLTDPYFGRGNGEFRVGNTPLQSVQQNQSTFLNLHISGDIGDWMAGGNMYDSPRAGNILFNPLGSLNTTVFLGLDNQNFSPSLPSTLANPEGFKKFGTLAGDTGFSVLNFGIKN